MKIVKNITYVLNNSCNPDYTQIGKYGVEAIKFLEQIFTEQPKLAARATCAASFCGTTDALPLLRSAASHSDFRIRVVVPHACTRVGGAEAQEIIEELLTDSSSGVRKMALHCVSRKSKVIDKLQKIAAHDSEEYLRELALDILANN